MKFNNFRAHQGDTQWFGLDEIPAAAKKIEKQFLAESERSGSMHALFGEYDQYEVEDGFIIDTRAAKEDCILNHTLKQHLQGHSMDDAKILPKKDHRHTNVPAGGIYYVGIHQRFDPLSASKERVRD